MLGGGLAAGLSVACTPTDPAVRSPGGGTPVPGGPSAPPSPLPPVSAAVAAEQDLAGAARNALASDGGLTGRQRALLRLVAQAHDERVAALTAPDPGGRPTATASRTPDPPPTPRQPSTPDGAATLARLARAELRAAARSRTEALSRPGLEALLQGSMAVASSGFAAALTSDDPPSSAAVAPHVPVALLSDTEAVSALVEALHATVWGYQLALGRLPVSGRPHARAATGLRRRRALQDRLVEQLIGTGTAVPPAQPAYDPSPEVRDAASAALLLRRLESRLMPFCGLWLAAAGTPADRRLAYDALASTSATAVAWGAPLTGWPGWQD